MAELYEPLCEDKGLEFAAELEPDLIVNGNRAFVAQALANLIDNAVKYTPPGGAVRVRVRRRSTGEVELSVTDTGPGVPEADRGAHRPTLRATGEQPQRAGSRAGAVAGGRGRRGARRGRLEITEGPGAIDGMGPGLRTALVLSGS
jgi:signal transduction histidine kinase